MGLDDLSGAEKKSVEDVTAACREIAGTYTALDKQVRRVMNLSYAAGWQRGAGVLAHAMAAALEVEINEGRIGRDVAAGFARRVQGLIEVAAAQETKVPQ